MAAMKPIVMENAEIWMRTKNFSGETNRFGNSDRTFCVFIDEQNAEAMAADGWRVKMTKPREDGTPGRPYIMVTVRYEVPDRLRPRIYRIAGNRRVELNAETVGCLDADTFISVDLVLNPRICEDGHIKAYAKEMWVTVEESPFYIKYNPEPEHAVPFN